MHIYDGVYIVATISKNYSMAMYKLCIPLFCYNISYSLLRGLMPSNLSRHLRLTYAYDLGQWCVAAGLFSVSIYTNDQVNPTGLDLCCVYCKEKCKYAHQNFTSSYESPCTPHLMHMAGANAIQVSSLNNIVFRWPCIWQRSAL